MALLRRKMVDKRLNLAENMSERMKKISSSFKNFDSAKKLAGMTVTFGNRKRLWTIRKVEVIRPRKRITAAIFTFNSPQHRSGTRNSEKEYLVNVGDFKKAIFFFGQRRKVGFQLDGYPIMMLHLPRKTTPSGAFAA